MYKALLKEFDAATKALKNENKSLGDARAILDSIMQLDSLQGTDFGNKHIQNTSSIVHFKAFEAVIVKLCNDSSSEVINVEFILIMCFLVTDEGNSSEEELPAAMRALKRMRDTHTSAFSDVN